MAALEGQRRRSEEGAGSGEAEPREGEDAQPRESVLEPLRARGACAVPTASSVAWNSVLSILPW